MFGISAARAALGRVCREAARRLTREPQLVVYTAILGGRDSLWDPTVITPNCRYVCFTDEPLLSEIWEIVRVPSANDPRRASRFYKFLPHRLFDTEYSIWVDGAFRVNVDARQLLARHLGRSTVAAFAHFELGCTYELAERFVSAGIADAERIRRQMQRYRTDGFPDRAGLSNCGVLLRRHTARQRALDEAWWHEYQHGSERDELSFRYAAWRLGVAVATIRGHTLQSADLELVDHRMERRRSEFDAAEWAALSPPRSVSSFPGDLSQTALEYSGIYRDGWLDDSAFFGLNQPVAEAPLVIRGMVPLVDNPTFTTELQVLADGHEIARESLGPGDFEVRVPTGAGTGRTRVELYFSDGQLLPEPFPRRVTALAYFIGFGCHCDTDADAR